VRQEAFSTSTIAQARADKPSCGWSDGESPTSTRARADEPCVAGPTAVAERASETATFLFETDLAPITYLAIINGGIANIERPATRTSRSSDLTPRKCKDERLARGCYASLRHSRVHPQ
jgi:hypothetical protein